MDALTTQEADRREDNAGRHRLAAFLQAAEDVVEEPATAPTVLGTSMRFVQLMNDPVPEMQRIALGPSANPELTEFLIEGRHVADDLRPTGPSQRIDLKVAKVGLLAYIHTNMSLVDLTNYLMATKTAVFGTVWASAAGWIAALEQDPRANVRIDVDANNYSFTSVPEAVLPITVLSVCIRAPSGSLLEQAFWSQTREQYEVKVVLGVTSKGRARVEGIFPGRCELPTVIRSSAIVDDTLHRV
jgi:hypothetical protein